MMQLQALHVADALVGRSRQLLRQLDIAGHVTLEATEAKEFAAELVDIARAIIITADSEPLDNASGTDAEVIDFSLRRRLRLALATQGTGDVA
jgi:hypothetical protein